MDIQDPARVRHALLVSELVVCAGALVALATTVRLLLQGAEPVTAAPALAWTIGCAALAVEISAAHAWMVRARPWAGAAVLSTGVLLICLGLLPVLGLARTAAVHVHHGAAFLIGLLGILAGIMVLVAQARPASGHTVRRAGAA